MDFFGIYQEVQELADQEMKFQAACAGVTIKDPIEWDDPAKAPKQMGYK